MLGCCARSKVLVELGVSGDLKIPDYVGERNFERMRSKLHQL